MAIKLVTPVFRVSFPNVFKAKAMPGSEPKFSVSAIFPKGTDLKEMRAAAKNAAEEKWGPDPTKWPKFKHLTFKPDPDKDGNPLTSLKGDILLPKDMEPGAIFVSLSNKERPGLVDRDKSDIIQPSDFYAGCWAVAHVNAFAWTHPTGGSGVSFSLNHIMKWKDGDPLGNRTRVEDAFAAIEPSAVAVGGKSGAVASAEDVFG